MSFDVAALLASLIVFCACVHEGEQQKKKAEDNLPGAGVSLLGLASCAAILISLAHIIVRLIAGS